MRVIVAVAAGVLLCACSTGVTGRGEYAVGSPTTPPASTAAPTPPPTPTPSPSPTPVRYDPGRATLACKGGTVLAPKGGPYCYRMPAGMHDVTGKVTLGAGTGAAKYVTSVGLAGRDLIVVMAYRTRLNTDLLPNGTIIGDLQGVLTSLTKAGLVFAGSHQVMSV